MSRYEIEKIMFMTPRGRELSFDPASLGYLPTVEEAGADFNSPLWDVLAIVEAANEPGVVIHLDEHHARAVKPYVRGTDAKLLKSLEDA